MFTLIISVMLAGTIFCYYTSNRAFIPVQNKFIRWVNLHQSESKIIGISLILVSFVIAMLSMGVASGIFGGLVILMSILSLLIITAPLRFFKWTVLIVIFITVFVVEFLIF